MNELEEYLLTNNTVDNEYFINNYIIYILYYKNKK